ncbi:MAG: hypothetical protein AAF266_00170 [Planctomycetota bacterium]
MARSTRLGSGTLAAFGLLLAVANETAFAAATDADTQAAPPLPTVVRFDPAAMPDAIATPAPPLGLRYSVLSDLETKALRRGFKLPLDALTNARSTSDLLGAAKVAPLPNPNEPLLPVANAGADGKTNPFVSGRSTSFRDDPMKALGELLAAVDGVDPTQDAGTAGDDPFAGDLAATPSPDTEEGVAAEVDAGADGDDPFATDADPFAGDEDPFGDF